MKRTRARIRIGETYYLPVVATEFVGDGGMIRAVTEDDGENVYVHPEALIPAKKEIEIIPLKKGGRR